MLQSEKKHTYTCPKTITLHIWGFLSTKYFNWQKEEGRVSFNICPRIQKFHRERRLQKPLRNRLHRNHLSSSQYSVLSLSFDLKSMHCSFKELSWGLSWGIWNFGDGWAWCLLLSFIKITGKYNVYDVTIKQVKF